MNDNQEDNEILSEKLEGLVKADPDNLQPDEVHVRGWTDINTDFIRSIEFAIVQPPIVRKVDQVYRIVDGCRRVKAAKRSYDEIEVVVYDWDSDEALSAHISLNTGIFEKSVSSSDRQRSLQKAFEMQDEYSSKARFGWDHGMLTTERIVRMKIGHIDGVGDSKITRIAWLLDNPFALDKLDPEDIEGIGPTIAKRIRNEMNYV